MTPGFTPSNPTERIALAMLNEIRRMTQELEKVNEHLRSLTLEVQGLKENMKPSTVLAKPEVPQAMHAPSRRNK